MFILSLAFLPAPALADYSNFMAGYSQELPFNARAADFVSTNNYQYMRPYMTYGMSQQLSPTNRVASATGTRKITPRSGGAVARAGTVSPTNPAPAARRVTPRPNQPMTAVRAAANNANTAMTTARAGRVVGAAGVAPSGQVNNRGRVAATAAEVGSGPDVSISNCMSEYKKCMDSYCSRPNTKYDRCYCSPRLSQLDAQFQPKIEETQRRLIALSIGGKNIDFSSVSEGIEFDWASAENRVQGQDAFLTGSRVCNERLRPCFSIANQLQNLYRSEMNRDCQRYEAYLNAHLQALEAELANFY